MEKKTIQISSIITATLIILIIGGFFLLRAFQIITIKNWWAIFIIIPAISSFGNLIEEISHKRPIALPLISSIAGILFSVMITLFFLFEWDWQKFAFYFILASGLILFQSGFIQSDDAIGRLIAMLRPWIFSGGLAVIITGIALTQAYHLTSQQFYRWLGVAILTFASAGVFQAWKINPQQKSKRFTIIINLLAAFLLSIPGFLALFNKQ